MKGSFRAARFALEGFLPSFLGGQVAPVGPLMGEEALGALNELIEQEGGPTRVTAARRAHAARITPDIPCLDLRPEEAGVVVAVHNLLSLSDPWSAGRRGSRSRRRAAEWSKLLAASLPTPKGPSAALAAHSLVAPLISARRKDLLVEYWVGRALYLGREAPGRILKLPRLRRVRIKRVDGLALDPEKSPAVVAIMRELFRYSPLTSLLHIRRDLPPFRLEEVACCVADPDLCRGLMRSWSAGPDVSIVGGRLARALVALCREPRNKSDLLFWLHAFYHLHVVSQEKALLQGRSAVQAGDPECRADDEDERWSLALFKVLHRGGEIFDIPGEEAFGEELAERLCAFDAAVKTCDTSEEERVIIEALNLCFNIVGFPGRPRHYPEPVSRLGV